MKWSDLLLRLRALLVWRRVEHELDEELRFHVEMQFAPEIPRERHGVVYYYDPLPSTQYKFCAQTTKATEGNASGASVLRLEINQPMR